MDLSVIIVNYNTKKLLDGCISSIYKFTNGVKFEVICVDNSSHDGSQELVKKKYPQVKLILNNVNLGFTRANNQGMKIARGKYILLLNSDTYLIENSLKKLVDRANTLNSRGLTPIGVKPQKGQVGALGPQLLNQDKSIQQSAGFFPHLAQVFLWMTFIDDLPGGQYLNPYHVDHDSFYQRDKQVDWVTAAAILVPKSVIKKASMLDEKIFMYGEEVEWCYRIKKAGYRVYFSPFTKIIHIGKGSSNQISTNAIIGEYKSIIYFYKKYKRSVSLQIVKLLLKIGALARIIIFRLKGREDLAQAYVEALKVD